MSNVIVLEKAARRLYFRGAPFSAKDKIKALGAKWDAEERCWWIGTSSQAAAEALVAELGAGVSVTSTTNTAPTREAPGLQARVAGNCQYKGKTYYLAARDSGSNAFGAAEPVRTKDESKFLLYFRDGSSSFWASRSEVQVGKIYQRPTTIGHLRAYAEAAKNGEAGACAECGRATTDLVDATDSSGLVAGCCRRCAALPQFERSFA